VPTNPHDFPLWATPSHLLRLNNYHRRQHTHFLSGLVLRHTTGKYVGRSDEEVWKGRADDPSPQPEGSEVVSRGR
jgi:hypothetical protein